MVYEFHGKTVLVTGGNDGIGRGIAQEAAKNGANVVIVARREEALQAAIKTFQPKYDDQKFTYVSGDLTNEEDVKRVVTHLQEEYGGLDVLIMSVGAGVFKPLGELTQADYDKMMILNLHTKVNMYNAAHPLLAKSDDPVVVSVSSEAAMEGLDYNGAYGASMAAVNNWTLNVRKEHKIPAYAICPGNVDTRVLRGVFSNIVRSGGTVKPRWEAHVAPKVRDMDEAQSDQWIASGTVRDLDEALAKDLLEPENVGIEAVSYIVNRPEEAIHHLESIPF